MTSVLWSADPFDWRLPGTGTIVGRVLSQTGPRRHHPRATTAVARAGQTLAAAPPIIAALRGRGYTFVTVSHVARVRRARRARAVATFPAASCARVEAPLRYGWWDGPMTTLSPPATHSAATRRLAENLGARPRHVARAHRAGLRRADPAHDLSLVEARVLRSLDRSHNAVRLEDLAERAGLEQRTAARAVAAPARARPRDRRHHRRRLGALTLTRHGRSIVRELDHTRRIDLQAFIEASTRPSAAASRRRSAC